MSASEHEARNRAYKVAALVALLRQQDATSGQVRHLDHAGRRAAEQLAGVRMASGATWAAVVATLESLEADPEPDDPFAGLT